VFNAENCSQLGNIDPSQNVGHCGWWLVRPHSYIADAFGIKDNTHTLTIK